MYCVIVHNSDEVKDCFVGESHAEILEKLKKSQYWEDIKERLFEEEYDGEDALSEDDIQLGDILELYHDGDSEDGYTLLTAK